MGKYAPGMEPVEMGRSSICIFCGSKQELTDEHVVPYSIAGPWVYRKATCRVCQDKFKPFESRILKRFLGPMRDKLEAPSRTPKTQPPSHTITLGFADGSTKDVTGNMNDIPVVISFPEIGPAGIGIPDANPEQVRIIGVSTALLDTSAAEKLVKQHGATEIKGELQVVPSDWLRLIGKVGYAFACAQYGAENVLESPIVPALLGISNDIGQWVGSLTPEESPPVPAGMVHHVQLKINDTTVLAMVRLFAQWNGPAYVVVCGRAKPGFTPKASSEFVQRKLMEKNWFPASNGANFKINVQPR